jgi:hypothetical protein
LLATSPMARPGLTPGTIDFYRKGLAALPDAFRNPGVAEVTPVVPTTWTRRRCERSTRCERGSGRSPKSTSCPNPSTCSPSTVHHALASRLPVARLRTAVRAGVPIARPASLPRHPTPRPGAPAVSNRLVHTSTAVTLNTYGHPLRLWSR